jgi:phosphoribosylformylglycinamidine synthase
VRFGVVGYGDRADPLITEQLLPAGCSGVVVGEEHELIEVDGVVLAGSVASIDSVDAPVMAGVAEVAASGGAVLGVGAGFAVLCARGLLPGSLVLGGDEVRRLHCIVEGRPTRFTWAIPAGRHLGFSQRSSGSYQGDLDELERAGQVVLRYCAADGEAVVGESSVAGICNQAGNVVGVIPEPVAAFFECAGGKVSRIPV